MILLIDEDQFQGRMNWSCLMFANFCFQKVLIQRINQLGSGATASIRATSFHLRFHQACRGLRTDRIHVT